MRKQTKIIAVLAPALTFSALFLAAQLSDGVASAQPPKGVPTTTPPFNSTEERKQLLNMMTEVNQRLGRIEAKLNAGLSVKVTDMPPVVVQSGDKK